jgi:hypothetical protein
MMKLRGMLTQLRQAASSESCSCALRLLDAAGWQRPAATAGLRSTSANPSAVHAL